MSFIELLLLLLKFKAWKSNQIEFYMPKLLYWLYMTNIQLVYKGGNITYFGGPGNYHDRAQAFNNIIKMVIIKGSMGLLVYPWSPK